MMEWLEVCGEGGVGGRGCERAGGRRIWMRDN